MKLLFEGDCNVGVIGHRALTNGIVTVPRMLDDGVMGVYSKRFLVGASPELYITDFRNLDYEDADGFMRPSRVEVWGDSNGFDIRLISVCDNEPQQSILFGTMRSGEMNIAEVEWEYYTVSPLNETIISFAVVIDSKIEVIDEVIEEKENAE